MDRDPRLIHALDLVRRGQRDTAARILRRLAKEGDAEAAAYFGHLIGTWLGPQDPPETEAHWYQFAAEAGSALGAFYHGLELAENIDSLSGEAADWHRRGLLGLHQLAEAGDVESQLKLWEVYEYEQGVEKDKDRALTYLRAAAKSGHLEALFHLGEWHWKRSDRTESERRRAIFLWRRAANGGLEDAQYFLGVRYATDPDMPINFKESVRFYKMAALNGNTEALYNLATMYQAGEGVAKDVAAGHAMMIEAAERGNYPAAYFLADAYAKGYLETPIDAEETAHWKARSAYVDEAD